MRGGQRTRRGEEEGESVFISMTDMTVSFLFIVMIVLAFFSTQIAPKKAIPETGLKSIPESNPIERYNFLAAKQVGLLLERIRARISAADSTIDVEISKNRDALEFKGDGLFDTGSVTPTAAGQRKMELIAGVLQAELGCFVLGDRSLLSLSCNPAIAMIDALQVEGHTDNIGGDVFNMKLGTSRGASVYAIMALAAPDVLFFKNLRDQPILSVASYGKGRPIRSNDSKEGRDANRRIDLRFIMFSPTEDLLVPQSIDDLFRLRRLLLQGAQP